MTIDAATLDKAVKELTAKTEARFQSITISNQSLSDQVRGLTSDIQSLCTQLSQKDEKIAELEIKFCKQSIELGLVNQRLLQLEVKYCRLNLVLQGLEKERPGVTLKREMKDLIKNKLSVSENIVLSRSYRINLKPDSVSRRPLSARDNVVCVIASCIERFRICR